LFANDTALHTHTEKYCDSLLEVISTEITKNLYNIHSPTLHGHILLSLATTCLSVLMIITVLQCFVFVHQDFSWILEPWSLTHAFNPHLYATFFPEGKMWDY